MGLAQSGPVAHSSLSGVDTDLATTSIHHTLGTGADQAAAGNHNHDTAYVEVDPGVGARPLKILSILNVGTVALPNDVNDYVILARAGASALTLTFDGGALWVGSSDLRAGFTLAAGAGALIYGGYGGFGAFYVIANF
jgi:hypothetical protein